MRFLLIALLLFMPAVAVGQPAEHIPLNQPQLMFGLGLTKGQHQLSIQPLAGNNKPASSTLTGLGTLTTIEIRSSRYAIASSKHWHYSYGLSYHKSADKSLSSNPYRPLVDIRQFKRLHIGLTTSLWYWETRLSLIVGALRHQIIGHGDSAPLPPRAKSVEPFSSIELAQHSHYGWFIALGMLKYKASYLLRAPYKQLDDSAQTQYLRLGWSMVFPSG